MDEGQIVEQNTPNEFFDNPRSDRTKFFDADIKLLIPSSLNLFTNKRLFLHHQRV